MFVYPARIVLSSTVVAESRYLPEFERPLPNQTVTLGGEAVLSCHVAHLGGYKVGWIKSDSKAIQAIHTHVITHNSRVSVRHFGHTVWQLVIADVQREDEGLFMCQINTDPMKSQVWYSSQHVRKRSRKESAELMAQPSLNPARRQRQNAPAALNHHYKGGGCQVDWNKVFPGVPGCCDSSQRVRNIITYLSDVMIPPRRVSSRLELHNWNDVICLLSSAGGATPLFSLHVT